MENKINRKKLKKFKHEFIEKVRRFHIKFGWKKRKALLDAIACFDCYVKDSFDGNLYEMAQETGIGKDLTFNLRHNCFCYYFD